MWDPPGPGLEPVSPALAGGFLTTAPPGKPYPKLFHYPCDGDFYLSAWLGYRCPGVWPNSILGVSVRVFLDEVSMWISRLNKAHCPPPMQVGITQPIEGLNRTERLTRPKSKGILLPDSPPTGPSGLPCSTAASGLWAPTGTSALQTLDLPASCIILWAIPYNKSLCTYIHTLISVSISLSVPIAVSLYIYLLSLCLLLFCFSGEPWLTQPPT